MAVANKSDHRVQEPELEEDIKAGSSVAMDAGPSSLVEIKRIRKTTELRPVSLLNFLLYLRMIVAMTLTETEIWSREIQKTNGGEKLRNQEVEEDLSKIKRSIAAAATYDFPVEPGKFIGQTERMMSETILLLQRLKKCCLKMLSPISTETAKLREQFTLLNLFSDLPVDVGPIYCGLYESCFEETREIGSGAFGTVYQVKEKSSWAMYAVKKIEAQLLEDVNKEEEHAGLGSKQINQATKEVLCLHALRRHPNIVHYEYTWIQTRWRHLEPGTTTTSSSQSFEKRRWNLAWITQKVLIPELNHWRHKFRHETQIPAPHKQVKSFSSDSSLCEHLLEVLKENYVLVLHIKMELCKTNLARWLEARNKHLEECQKPDESVVQESLKVFRQIMEGMAYMHSKGIYHGDIKPDNIFTDFKGVAKVGDFGLTSLRSRKSRSGCPSTSGFSSASGCRDLALSGIKGDIYCLSMLLIELLIPFHTDARRIKEVKIIDSGRVPPGPKGKRPPTALEALKAYPKDVMQLISAMRNENDSDRPTAQEILAKPLLSQVTEETDQEANEEGPTVAGAFCTDLQEMPTATENAAAAVHTGAIPKRIMRREYV